MVEQACDPSPRERRAGRPEVQGRLNSSYQASLSSALLCCENKQMGRVENPSLLGRCGSAHHCHYIVQPERLTPGRKKHILWFQPQTPGIPHSPVLSPQDFPPVLVDVAGVVFCHNILILWGGWFFFLSQDRNGVQRVTALPRPKPDPQQNQGTWP